jgi:hypothetical protein
MEKYFIEFEFKSKIGNKYWLPLFIEANNEQDAEEIRKRIETALSEENEILRTPKPKIYQEHTNSKMLDEYIEKRYKGKIEKLELNMWDFKDIEPSPELNFNESIKLIDFEKKISSDDREVANTILRQKFPVRLLSKNEDFADVDDFLFVNVVAPKFINKLVGAFKNRRV